MNQNAFIKPNYGEFVFVLFPKTEHQNKWKHLIRGGAAIVGFKINDDNYSICFEYVSPGPFEINKFKKSALVAYDELTQRFPILLDCTVPSAEFEACGQMTDQSFNIIQAKSSRQWLALNIN